MEEYARYGKNGSKIIREILLNYKKKHHLTNQQMSVRCDISLSEYDKIININRHGNQGLSYDTLHKIRKNLGISIDSIIDSVESEI